MARVTDRDSGHSLLDPSEIEAFLAGHGLWYRSFETELLPLDATDEEILALLAPTIRELEEQGGYTTADVISVTPNTPGLDAMMQKFTTEHVHSEDEVRLIVSGRGLFHVHPESGSVFAIEVAAGDMINVPAGTKHWFHLCEDRSIRAVRLFQNAAGWMPEYSESGIDAAYQPLCMGTLRPSP